MKTVLAVLLLILSSQSSFAEKSNIDLRGDVLGPVFYQSDIGWCFAYAASDMLSTTLKERISPKDMAITYLDKLSGVEKYFRQVGTDIFKKDFKFEGGYGASAIRDIAKIGTCALANESDTVSFADGSSFISLLQNKQIDQNSSCNQRDKPFSVSVESFGPATTDGTPEDSIAAIDASLEAGRAAGMVYNPYKLMNDSHKDLNGQHESSIVGRRTVNGITSYLVRNSWGNDCDYYRDGIECDGGNFWLTEDQIKDIAQSIDVITKLKRK